jgi:hypothetical protein
VGKVGCCPFFKTPFLLLFCLSKITFLIFWIIQACTIIILMSFIRSDAAQIYERVHAYRLLRAPAPSPPLRENLRQLGNFVCNWGKQSTCVNTLYTGISDQPWSQMPVYRIFKTPFGWGCHVSWCHWDPLTPDKCHGSKRTHDTHDTHDTFWMGVTCHGRHGRHGCHGCLLTHDVCHGPGGPNDTMTPDTLDLLQSISCPQP